MASSMMRGVVVSISTFAMAAVLACDPKIADPADEDGESEGGDADDESESDSHTSLGSGATSGPDTSDSDDDGDQPGTSVGSGPDTGCEGEGCDDPPPSVQHAYAIRFGDLPPIDVGESDSGGSGGSGGTEIDPDTLLVVITNGPDDCDDPWAALACGQWSVSFSLPPGTVAGTYALFPDLNGSSTATGPADEFGECWFGGGSLEGTVELSSVDGPIVGQISDAQAFDFDANVAFSATLCE